MLNEGTLAFYEIIPRVAKSKVDIKFQGYRKEASYPLGVGGEGMVNLLKSP